MSEPTITDGDPIIYGSYTISSTEFTIAGLAHEDSVTVTPIADATDKKVGGVTVMEQYKDPGLELSGDFIITTGDADNLIPGKLLDITFPGAQVAIKFVIQAAPQKYDVETNSIIVSLRARHRYAMASAYATGAIDPDTGSAYAAGFSISGQVIVAATGAPLAGVSVSDGTRSGTTDANGEYTIINVPAGEYTLTPTKANYTFAPAAHAEVTVSTANLRGKSFIATAD
jgi:hypothetical protein